MKKILMSGGNGRLATQIQLQNKDYKIVAPPTSEMDVSNYESVDKHINIHKPDYFIHCGALTKPMILHEQKPEKSIRINIQGTSNVTLACMKYNTKLIYISTDYVYEGTNGNYSEDDALKPFNKYGWSKLGGECSVQMYDNSLILRLALINKPFDYSKAFTDVYRSLLYEDDAAKLCLQLLDAKGVLNIGGSKTSVYEFAKKDKDVEPMSVKEISNVNMPNDTSLNTNKLNEILKK